MVLGSTIFDCSAFSMDDLPGSMRLAAKNPNNAKGYIMLSDVGNG